MYSFYGGHPGSSVNITGHYTTYENLVNAFQSTNCPVRVGEYASIINSSNPNYSYNGNVYQRPSKGSPILVGKFAINVQLNQIEQISINDQNHLLIKYTDSTKGDLQGWNDVGDITTNIVLNKGTQNNLNWCGLGKINHRNSKSILKFIIPLSTPLSNKINNISISSGALIIQKNGTNIDGSNITLSSINSSISRTILGLEFTTNYSNQLQIQENQIVNISISNLSLIFS